MNVPCEKLNGEGASFLASVPHVGASGAELMIPAAGHIKGAAGTNWRTEVVVHNLAAIDAVATVQLLERDRANGSPRQATVTVPAGASLRWKDALDELFSYSGAAALRFIVSQGSVVITSRTFNLLEAGNPLGLPAGSTFGQFIPALDSKEAIPFGAEGRLVQLGHDPGLTAGSRTNLGLVNAGTGTIEVEAELWTGDGQDLGTVRQTLRGHEYVQIDRVFEKVTGSAVANGVIVVRTTTAGGAFYAQAYVIDNRTGDPIAVTAVRGLPAADLVGGSTTAWVIPATAHVRGFGGADWRTDAVVYNPSSGLGIVTVQALVRGQPGPGPSVTLSVPARQAVRIDDLLDSLFALSGAAALLVTDYSGAIVITSRTYNLLGAGNSLGLPEGSTFGQYVAAEPFTGAMETGASGILLHLSHDPSLTAGNRTNLGLANVAASAADVEISLYTGDGTLLGTFSQRLAGFEYTQIDKVFEKVTGAAVDDGYLVVRPASASAKVVAQAYVIDNRTGDPVAVPAVVLPGAQPMTPVELATTLGGMLGSDTAPITAPVSFFASQGTSDALDTIAAIQPAMVSRTSTGVSISYGDGTANGAGTIVTGAMTLDASGLTSDSSGVHGTLVTTYDGLALDGRAMPLSGLESVFGLDLDSGGNVSGQIQLTAPAPASAASSRTADIGMLQGTVEFDTSVCANYPVGGTITVTVAGETRRVKLDAACNGGFGYVSPSAKHYVLQITQLGCTGQPEAEDIIIHLIGDDGVLVPDPTAQSPGVTGPGRWQALGVFDSFGDVEIAFQRWPGSTPQGTSVAGVFHGKLYVIPQSASSTRPEAARDSGVWTGWTEYIWRETDPRPECSASYVLSPSTFPLVDQGLTRCSGSCS